MDELRRANPDWHSTMDLICRALNHTVPTPACSACEALLVNNAPRIAFAANRNIGFQALRLLLHHDLEPVALLLPSGKSANESVEAIQRLLPDVPMVLGNQFRSERVRSLLQALNLDYILSVHFPYIIPANVLKIPRIGTLNLHPALLPFNRGWHTPSWAILEQTPYGATLHWVDEGMDTGDVALQREVPVLPSDTAHTLYQRVLAVELELLREAIPLLKANSLPCIPQSGQGSRHVKAQLDAVRRLDLEQRVEIGELFRKVRALTTNREDEAAWFELDGQRYLVQISIRPDPSQQQLRRAA